MKDSVPKCQEQQVSGASHSLLEVQLQASQKLQLQASQTLQLHAVQASPIGPLVNALTRKPLDPMAAFSCLTVNIKGKRKYS